MGRGFLSTSKQIKGGLKKKNWCALMVAFTNLGRGGAAWGGRQPGGGKG